MGLSEANTDIPAAGKHRFRREDPSRASTTEVCPRRGRFIKEAVKHRTIQRVATPTAIIVGLSEDLAELCTDTLGEAGLRVLRVGHVAAASERIPIVMPQLVLVSTALRPDELESLNDRCVAVGAHVVKVAPKENRATLGPMLKSAANAALVKALRGG